MSFSAAGSKKVLFLLNKIANGSKLITKFAQK